MLALAFWGKGYWVISPQRIGLLKGHKFPGISCCFEATCISNGWERGCGVARSLKDLPKFCLFLCEPPNHPSWAPHYLKQKGDEYALSFSTCKCSLAWVNMTMFVLPGEQVKHEVPFVPIKNKLPHSQIPEGLLTESKMLTCILPRKEWTLWSYPGVEISIKFLETDR